MLDYKLTKLKNGLRVITAPVAKTRAVTILFLFGVGSRYEESRLSGISHFLEHMFFKGTEKRPTTLDISKTLDGVGASYNAFTGEEYTGYYVHIPSGHFDLGLDVLSDMIFNSKFDAKEIEKEKGVIVEELNMVNDDPKIKVEMVARELVYPGHPLGRKITGEKETVTKFNRDDFVDYKKAHYNPENMVIAIAGNAEKNWLTEIKKKFEGMPLVKKNQFLPVSIVQKEPAVKVFYKPTDQAHFILGFHSFSRKDKRRPILRVLTNIMGQMMSSRLFIEVREKRGLCYYVFSDLTDFHDTGFWSVSAGVDINRIGEAIKVILTEIKKIRDTEITDEELKRAKENLKGHLYLGLEDSMSVAMLLSEQELLWEKIQDPDEIAADYDKVTKKQIMDLAGEIFKKENLNFAIVGPFKEEEKFKKILKEY